MIVFEKDTVTVDWGMCSIRRDGAGPIPVIAVEGEVPRSQFLVALQSIDGEVFKFSVKGDLRYVIQNAKVQRFEVDGPVIRFRIVEE